MEGGRGAVRVPSSPYRSASGMASTLGTGANRFRSASPSRRALAIDMRRIASLLRDPAGALQGTGESMNNSICSSPNSAWEPGDRGAAPTSLGASARAASLSRMVMQNQFTALAERMNTGVSSLQRQCEVDRRRLAQLEKKLEAQLDDRADKHDGRERWAEVQGSVNGLIEETQALARRVDGLDERLWTRTSGSEVSKQRNRELEQQVQALEQQNRLAAAAAEETQKRQATKIRRAEHSLEEVLRRMATMEDEVRQKNATQRDGYIEARVNSLEQTQEALDADIRALQASLEDGLQIRDAGQEGADLQGADIFEAIRKSEMGLSALDRKVSSQVEDLSSSVASLRVKVDGLLSRVGGLAERIETAHEPAIESLRLELSQARQQERREFDTELQTLKNRLQQAQESNEEACGELREALRQSRSEVAALSYRPDIQQDNSWIRNAEERLAGHEQDLYELRERLELVQADASLDGKAALMKPAEDFDDFRRRLEWLEEHGAAAADKSDSSRISQVQNSVCDLVEQVSRLKQQAASSEANATSWQQQVKQIHSLIERRQSEDSASMRITNEVEAKVGALSAQVADMAARMLEVEGNLDFVRENDLPAGQAGTPERATENEAPGQPSALQEKLEAVAEHLEVVDDLSDRIAELERRFSTGPDFHPMGSSSPGPVSEVSFGGEAPLKVAAGPADAVAGQLGELQLRMDAIDLKMKSVQEAAALKQSKPDREAEEKLEALKHELSTLTSRLSAAELQLGSAKEAASEVESLRKEVASKTEAPAELAALRSEFLDKLAECHAAQDQSKRSAATAATDVKEVRDDVVLLSEKVDATLEDLQEGLTAAKQTVEAVMAPIKQELKELRSRLPDADAEASAEQALLEKLEEVERKMSDMQAATSKASAVSSEAPAVKDGLEEKLLELQTAFARIEQAKPDCIDDTVIVNRLDALDKRMNEDLQRKVDKLEKYLEEEIDAIKDRIKEEVAGLGKRLDAALASVRSAQQDTSKQEQDQLMQMEELQRRLLELPEVTVAPADFAELKEQVKQVELKVSSGLGASFVPSSGGTDAAEDTKLRAQVQQQVQEMAAQLSKEVANLAQHQKEIVDTKATVEDLATQLKAHSAPARDVEDLASLRTEFAALADRVASTETNCSATKKDLEALLGPRNKIGISMSSGNESPLAEVCGRLDLLTEQVAELQNRQEDSHTGSASLKGTRKDSVASADGSLNFSLTEQTERPGAPGDSLNFSLTEQTAKGDFSSSEPFGKRPAGPGISLEAAEEDSDLDEILSATDSPLGGVPGQLAAGLAELGSGKDKSADSSRASSTSDGPGGRPRPAPLKTEEEKSLPTVAEETELGEPTPTSKGSTSKASTPGKARPTKSPAALSASASASVDSPMNGSGALDASSSQVSASCNEMSIGMDYSVELSTELDEKCDFVEVVRPVAKRGAGLSNTVGTIEEAAEEEEPVRDRSADEKSVKFEAKSEATSLKSAPDALDALDALMPKGESEAKAKGGDALDSLLSSKPGPPSSTPSSPPGPGNVLSPKAKEAAKEAKKEETKEKDEDEYADASFDGSMSVPESINEEEGSGSDAWGSEEDV
ncbi:unnamed protein product [Symbiodinium natans]|uniref:Uncharacterized protein n=1 Tax=Symbiodinium natans TaxID=878477 RepID=A0A812QD18_9DINO|nr:unnamed protein product [Symbiodinium natans]